MFLNVLIKIIISTVEMFCKASVIIYYVRMRVFGCSGLGFDRHLSVTINSSWEQKLIVDSIAPSSILDFFLL